jgi:hypothetical protein
VLFSSKVLVVESESDLDYTRDKSAVWGYMTNYTTALRQVLPYVTESTIVVFMTDGEPNDGGAWQTVAASIQARLVANAGGFMTAYYLQDGTPSKSSKSNMERLCTNGQTPSFVSALKYVGPFSLT